MNGEREQFGPGLRSQRERQGITLESISENTKIKRSLLAGLERNDVSQWPHGIFRRAYVRDYAGAIGLDPEPVLAKFLRLYPEHSSGDVDRGSSTDATPPLRLTFAFDEDYPLRKLAAQALAAATEAVVVLVAAAVLTLLFDASFWVVATLLAVLYFSVAGALTGRAQEYPRITLVRLSRGWRRPRKPLPLDNAPQTAPPVEEEFASHTTVAS